MLGGLTGCCGRCYLLGTEKRVSQLSFGRATDKMWRHELTVSLLVCSLMAPAARAVSIDTEEQGFVDQEADAIVIEGWISN